LLKPAEEREERLLQLLFIKNNLLSSLIFTFKRQDKIRKGREYSRLKNYGKVFRSKRLVFNYSLSNHSRLGVIVTKKVGNAVMRNKVKRWVREVFRLNRHVFASPLELVIIPRSSDLSYDHIKRDFLFFAEKYNEKVADNTN
jgi:ribonuclease P protein component